MSFWRLTSVCGVVLAIAGVVLLVWIELSTSTPFNGTTYRLQIAIQPLMLAALGLLVTAAGAFMDGQSWERDEHESAELLEGPLSN
jgi:hypothetical protein